MSIKQIFAPFLPTPTPTRDTGVPANPKLGSDKGRNPQHDGTQQADKVDISKEASETTTASAPQIPDFSESLQPKPPALVGK